ncbi:MAG: Holliday junction branch migration protein RuvA [Planctomycetota bacterium]|nr:Holliday junction branch migration protein RuvA [Planctomycetota bacterium]MDP6519713.1 Holliday junction branch migration protein RuvA [Planctomycetota bacterium]MDP6762526.1 Holliday junction branch migration protein RuvA [Planctomycetota bacterium]
MYDFLAGTVVERSLSRLVVEVGGVGFELAVPLGAEFPVGEAVRVWTHLLVREDAQRLFGFEDRSGRDLFRLLLSVRGVGPAMALGLLSGLARDELLAAIRGQEAAPLTNVKGVGRKTAEQILLDLRDKPVLPGEADTALGAEQDQAGGLARSNSAGETEDAVLALMSVGYKEKEARREVGRAVEAVGSADLEILVRHALKK